MRRFKLRIGKENALLALVSLSVGLVAIEGMARLLPERFFVYNTIFKGDPLLGSPLSNQPEKDFPEQVKPANVYRIVVLGDSHTVSVRNEASYPEVLESLLNRDTGGKRVEVYNGGSPGHSNYQYYLSLNDRLKRYQPDLVIVGFYIGNDFLDLYRNDDRPSLFFDGRQFVHKAPEFHRYSDPDSSGMVRSSRIFQLAQLFLRKTVGYQLSRVGALWALGKQSGEGNRAAARYLYTMTRGYFINQHIFRQGMNQILFLRSFPKERLVIDRVNRKATELIKDAADSGHTKLLYVPIPTRLQVEPEADRAVLERTLTLCGFDRSALKLEDELYESLFALLDEHGIDALRIKDTLEKAADTSVLYDDTYHLTEAAHAIVGQALHDKVRPMLTDGLSR